MIRAFALGTAVLLAACSRSGPKESRSIPPELTGAGEKAELLFLGTFHFDDPGLDAYQPRFRIDIGSADRQRELERLTEQLAAFRPTRVAVEAESGDQSRLDSLYQGYRQGTYVPGPNEIYQIGFRLARRIGLRQVHAVDAPARSYLTGDQARAKIDSLGGMEPLMRRIREDPWTRRYQQLYARDDSLKMERTLAEHLLSINDPERVRIGHGAYLVGSFKFGAALDYIGPDDATSWYNRNLRIFSNLQALTVSADERILLIIGAGHLPILRFLAASSPEHRLRELSEFVTP